MKMDRSITLTNGKLASLMSKMEDGKLIMNPAVESLKKKKLPVKLQYSLRKVFLELTEKYNLFEETKQAIINEHGEKNEKEELNVNEGRVNIPNMAEFNKDVAELINIEVTFNSEKVKLDLGLWDNNPNLELLSGEEMDLILPLVMVINA